MWRGVKLFFSLRPPCRFQIEIPVSKPFLLLYFITINDTNCLLNFGYWRVCSNSYLSAGDGPQIPDFNFPILSKMNELAMLYFFIIYMKTPLLRIAPSLHPRIYWKYPQIWQGQRHLKKWRDIEYLYLSPISFCTSYIEEYAKITCNCSSDYAACESSGGSFKYVCKPGLSGDGQIAQVMEFLRATVSPYQKRFKQRPGVFVFTVIN